MSATTITQAAQFSELTRAADGFRNMRAVASLLISWFAAVLLVSLAGLTGAPALIGLTSLIAIVVVLTGISAAGIHLMVQIRSWAPRPLATGFLQGLFATGKIIVLALAVIVVALLFLLPIALILLICKIPFLGPLLFTFVVPLLTVGTALFYAGLFVAWQLLGPAIWEGNTLLGSIARLAAIARQRAVSVIINLIILAILIWIAAFVLFGFLASGYGVTTSLSSGILGNQLPGGIENFGAVIMGGANVTGHQVALGIGTLITASLAVAIITCPVLMGLNIIYVNASAGIDASSMESRINQSLAQAKAKAAEMQETARSRPQAGGADPSTPPPVEGGPVNPPPGGPGPDNRT